ncbi:MAG TPA: hypothetical protein VF083_00535 [Acidimicrobiia bacterium]
MKSSHMMRLAVSGLLLLVVAACNGDETTDLSTTSSLIASPTSVAGSETTTSVGAGGGDSTTTSLRGESVSGHEIVARESDPAGETLFVLIPPGAYTDVDIENFVVGLVDDGTVTFGAEVFDDPGAIDAYRKPEAERTEGEVQLIEDHHFASIQNGSTVVFRGPFAGSPDFVIGS